MQSFKNDNEIILKQKIIHLGAEVKRLTSELEKLKQRTYFLKLEKKNEDLVATINQMEREKAEMENQLSEKVTNIEEQIQEERANHRVTLEKNQFYLLEISKYQSEISRQSAVNAKLEQEYEKVKKTVKELIMQIEKTNQAKQEIQKIAEINEKLEEENLQLQKHVDELTLESKNFKEENSSLIKDMKRLNESLGNLQRKNEDLVGEMENQLSEKVANIEEQFKEERANHRATLEKNQFYQNEISKYQSEISRQSAINVKLEQEYEMVKETVKELIMKIEKTNQDKQEFQKIAEINEKLEEENLQLHKHIDELTLESKNLKEGNSSLIVDIKRLNESVVNLQRKVDQKENSVTATTKPKEKEIQEEEVKIQSWFYNNVKKEK
ncbi:hypothetical protein [Sutcliffiella horikoshii]|uniref:hypothetical protein n=1 Tax=Sutcliffiella horikoshii TaxID=79883 RepID=UPI001F213F0D|nr:hypothetical protein [Sutcliffiella horikoshii]MCG1020153.1 hypothetical protein [Sutcliffiella horikoshii]